MTDFEEYVSARGRALVRFALMLCGDEQRAEDIVQGALARAFRSWRRIGPMPHLEAYIKRIILHEWLSWRRLRSSSEIPVGDFKDDVAGVIAPPDEPSTVSGVWHALATLTTRQRAVLVLRYYEDLPDREIADILKCSEPTVRSTALRSLAHLRTYLSKVDERTSHD